MYQESKLTLFIDIGTNGEIVVGNRDWMVCAACSAGPAFEGGGIRFGMRATQGAIEDVSVNPDTFEPMLMTIGMVKPKGICGSGLINILAALMETGLVDPKGKFRDDLDTPHIRQGESGREYVLASAPNTQVNQDIVLSEVDIDNLMRAKGAMYAGYITLLESVGLSILDLEQIILAGAFGSFINIEDAITIGLLPDLPLEKFTYVGNGSLLGATMVAFSREMLEEERRVALMMTNFELSETPGFMDRYMAALFLPHTKAEYFPSVMKRLEGVRQEIAVSLLTIKSTEEESSMKKSALAILIVLACLAVACNLALAKQDFYGNVEKMPEGGMIGEWVVGGRTVTATKDTVFKEKHGKLEMGAYVEVEGRRKRREICRLRN